MSEAALSEDTELSNDIDLGQEQDQKQEGVEVEQSESATEVEEAPKEDGFQKRINKVTADKYNEKRRADDLQRQLDDMQAKPKEAGAAPKLEDFDHDEGLFNTALIDHKVSQAVQAQVAEQNKQTSQANAQDAAKAFNDKVVEFGKDDFHDVAAKIPALDPGLVAELMSSKEGVEMIYHLGEHLDVADKIANMRPLQAMAELSRISSNMYAKKDVKTSAAPDPIEPLSSGGSISKESGPEGATYE
ncbi:MAG: hypothetical protein JKX72_02600 [Robiginitomaculum sp.]|nr:hypothetical protein [Robiginitomaculum sp.]